VSINAANVFQSFKTLDAQRMTTSPPASLPPAPVLHRPPADRPATNVPPQVNQRQVFQQLLQMLLPILLILLEKFASSPATPPPAPPAGASALALAGSSPNFSTLNTLVGTAGLGTALTEAEAKGPITILAPTNAAFAALPPAISQKLQKPENKAALQEILQYHVSAGALAFNPTGAGFNSLLPDEKDKTRLFGTAEKSTVLNNGTEISTAGPAIRAANGSIIVPVNQVLLPPGLDLSKLV
jgi:uncharacterized surface protein with fasciclin (FAS1) repeats